MKLQVGSYVTFQFIETYQDGPFTGRILRHAEGTINCIDGGLFNIMCPHTLTITYHVLPWACRPARFTEAKLRSFIRDYAYKYENKENKGRLLPEEAHLTELDFKISRDRLYEFIGWLK